MESSERTVKSDDFTYPRFIESLSEINFEMGDKKRLGNPSRYWKEKNILSTRFTICLQEILLRINSHDVFISWAIFSRAFNNRVE